MAWFRYENIESIEFLLKDLYNLLKIRHEILPKMSSNIAEDFFFIIIFIF